MLPWVNTGRHMPTKPLLLLLLSMLTSCTAFGPDGTMPMALHRDMVNRFRDCPLSDEAWMEKCGDDYWERLSSQQKQCPKLCKPPKKK